VAGEHPVLAARLGVLDGVGEERGSFCALAAEALSSSYWRSNSTRTSFVPVEVRSA
jgi:hypothetical protein